MAASVPIYGQSFDEPVAKTHVPRCQTEACVLRNPSLIRAPLGREEELLPVDVWCEGPEYKLVVPLSGIDPRNVYVFATPHSVLIEIRFKNSLSHESEQGPVIETVERRISRELSLPIGIEERATSVHVCGDCLQITARQAGPEHPASWSELIHFDTRKSLGSV